jgi:hypothetical protein
MEKGKGDCSWAASPSFRSLIGHLRLSFPHAAAPPFLPVPARCGPVNAGPSPTYHHSPGTPTGGTQMTSPPASAVFLPSPFLLLSPFCTLRRRPSSAPPRSPPAVHAHRSDPRRPRVPHPALHYKMVAAAPRRSRNPSRRGEEHPLHTASVRRRRRRRRRRGGAPELAAGSPSTTQRRRPTRGSPRAPRSQGPRRPCFLCLAPPYHAATSTSAASVLISAPPLFTAVCTSARGHQGEANPLALCG